MVLKNRFQSRSGSGFFRFRELDFETLYTILELCFESFIMRIAKLLIFLIIVADVKYMHLGTILCKPYLVKYASTKCERYGISVFMYEILYLNSVSNRL